jgi:hypothetical protein
MQAVVADRKRRAVPHLIDRGILGTGGQAILDRRDQEEAEDGDDQGGQHQRGGDHPQLQRAMPAALHLGDEMALPPAPGEQRAPHPGR